VLQALPRASSSDGAYARCPISDGVCFNMEKISLDDARPKQLYTECCAWTR
jgi:hypothetical protein